MTRILPVMAVSLFAILLSACQQAVSIDPSASPWVLEVLSGQCKSAIPYRARASKIPESPTYFVVRSMVCPTSLDGSSQSIELMQLRTTSGDFFWVEAENVRR